MAARVPASLRQAGIARFVLRASQLEQAKPVIAYWCNYWIVQQIIAKDLHSVDDEALVYTTTLMDKLEKFKQEHSNDEAVTGDTAGKAVVEQFGLETFTRADNAVRADKASKQTADTFQAAATFLELLAIWGKIEPEITQKIKFAKFHALRIEKALKAGEDPNLSNPTPEPRPEEAVPPLDPNDPEVQLISGGYAQGRQPSVVEVPDESDSLSADLARQSVLNESIHPSRAPSAPPPQETTQQESSRAVSPISKDAASFYAIQNSDVSPISPDRKSSVGGNYFPRISSPSSGQNQPNQPNLPPTLPSAPSDFDSGPALPSAPESSNTAGSTLDLPSAPPDFDALSTSESSLPHPPTTFAQAQPPTPRTPLDSFQPPPAPRQPPSAAIPQNLVQDPSSSQPSFRQPHLLQPSFTSPVSPPTVTPSTLPVQPSFEQRQPAPFQPAHAPAPPTLTSADIVADEEAMLKAQKHARWAISALNFEDVPTAIREFEQALKTLGAR